MAAEPKVCVDRVLPADLERRKRLLLAPPDPVPGGLGSLPSRLAVIGVKRWDNGRNLAVSFLDGDPDVQARVEAHAVGWNDHANLNLDFGADETADIRISFLHRGSWSYIGTDARGIDGSEPTMNFGWLGPDAADDEYERVVKHEFGHALGAIHEHQNPAANIPWDRTAVLDYFMGPPNNWTKEQVEINLFRLYEEDITQFTDFDPESIMLYPIQQEFTIGDFSVGWNHTLSETDEQFIASIYPAEERPESALELDGTPTTGKIGEHGEEDRYTFTLDEPGRFLIETFGKTDVVMALTGPDDSEQIIAEDDDAGRGLNARIEANLDAGNYVARVWHYWPSGTGDYQVGLRSG